MAIHDVHTFINSIRSESETYAFLKKEIARSAFSPPLSRGSRMKRDAESAIGATRNDARRACAYGSPLALFDRRCDGGGDRFPALSTNLISVTRYPGAAVSRCAGSRSPRREVLLYRPAIGLAYTFVSIVLTNRTGSFAHDGESTICRSHAVIGNVWPRWGLGVLRSSSRKRCCTMSRCNSDGGDDDDE